MIIQVGIFIAFVTFILFITLWYFGYFKSPFVYAWGDDKDKNAMINMLANVDTTLKDMNINWYVSFGTLLGAKRHQNIIPWDDDIDIHVDEKLEKRMPEFIERMEKFGYNLDDSNSNVPWKIFLDDRRPWPFIDLFYFRDDGTTVFDTSVFNEKKLSYNTTDIFPVVYTPFAHIAVPCPKNACKILTDEFGANYMSECVSSGYDHKKARPIINTKKISCSSVMK
jgi:hypothetical protein